MPRRIVSIRRRGEVGGLRSHHVELLFRGWNTAQLIGHAELSTDEARALWRRHRATLLRWYRDGIPDGTFRETHFGFAALKAEGLFVRPWAWWKFDAPDERRRLLAVVDMIPREGTSFHDFVERDPTAEDLTRAWRDGEAGERLPEGGAGGFPYRFESEAEYLERHGLLTAEERRAIKQDEAEDLAAQNRITNR